jgi:hypothetical protein
MYGGGSMGKLKQKFCKHRNKEEEWIYPRPFVYNEYFGVACTIRRRVYTCKDCGKVIVKYVQWVTCDQIEKEVIEEYREREMGER